jgi:RNA polymerase sigma-70 factor (ECF subfamily)
MSTPLELPVESGSPFVEHVPTTEHPGRPMLSVVPDAPGTVDFDDFVRRYEGRLRRLVLRRLGDPSEAEEIAQETLLRAYQHRTSFTAENELIAWCTVVAQRLVIDRARVRGRSVAVAEVPESARVGRDTADIVVARQEARAALDALEAIPARQAAILWAREVEGLHYEEIADRFDISEPAVRSLLHRGRRALRKEYLSRGHAVPVGGLIPLAPWLLSLRRVERLRDAARSLFRHSSTTAAALSIAGLAVLGVTAGGGARSGNVDLHRLPASVTAIERTAATHHLAPATTAIARRRPAALVAGAQAAPVTQARPVAPATKDLVPMHKLPGGCVPTGSSGSKSGLLGTPGTASPPRHVCAEAGPNDQANTVYVGPELPDNPTRMRRVYVTTDSINCASIPDVPLTSCEPASSSDSSNPQNPSRPTP